ncbi:TetR/AcrR family transcriptional regulator [Amycolatopsis sp. NPDC059657]|uniref:TetR/AcrR family transcriptional regulator n=1 Tax=Amycolatopsis sp. NPDC059657 TaxID=3346899 RepID=UPI00366E2191
MATSTRKERDRADRGLAIIAAARELAEAEGWDAVTTRRLSAKIEYSQPVLYSHFAGKDAIMAAAAVEGCAELAADLRKARKEGDNAHQAMAALARAYVAFADDKPALYEAIFTLPTELKFGGPDAPQALKDAFAELLAIVGPVAGDRDVETLTETFWAALHGIVTLNRNGRHRPQHREARLALLVDQFAQGTAD